MRGDDDETTDDDDTSMTDLRDADWYQFVLDIDNLLATGRFTWAETTLREIQTTVTQARAVTARQRAAVQHIEDARAVYNPRRYPRG